LSSSKECDTSSKEIRLTPNDVDAVSALERRMLREAPLGRARHLGAREEEEELIAPS